MKKYAVVFLLCAVFLLSLIPTVGYAQAAQEAEGVYCEKCDLEVLPEAWQEWNFTGGNVPTGHYRLTDDFNGQTKTLTVAKGAIVCLDLRGKIYNTEDIKVFAVSGTLAVMDSVGGGMILTTGQSDQLGGFASVSSTGMLNLYGGTVRFVEKEDITIAGGGLVYANNGIVNIYGGTLQGGVTRPAVIDTKTYKGYGGNVYLLGGATLNMSAGGIIGGMSRLNPEVSITSGIYSSGGNIFADGSEVNIYGGKVSGGYADREGGNIYLVSGATLKLSGEGVIENGHAYNNGGNISVYSLNNAIDILGGKVTGGVAGGAVSDAPFGTQGSGGGGNLYVYGSGSTLNISGGTIDGDIKVDIAGAVTLSGAPTINLGKANGLKLKSGIKLDVSGMTGGVVYVDATGVFAENVADAATVATYFKGAIRTAVAAEGTTLVATQGTTGYCPHCQQSVTWTAVNGNWTANGTLSTAGHYYVTSFWRAYQTIKADTILDLNGHAIGPENSWTFSVGTDCKLDVLDSVGGGQIVGTNKLSAVNLAPMVYVQSNATFTLHSGTVRQVAPWTSANKGKEAQTYMGGAIYGAGAATVKLQGGIVRDGVASVANSAFGAAGGNIGFNNTAGVFEMTGGIVMGGEAAAATYNDETCPGKGGNLYTPGGATISGGFILDGKATDGGNLYFGNAKTTRIISGGTICSGTATEEGGNIYLSGASDDTGVLNISKASVICGEAATAGNIYVAYATVNIHSDGAVLGGTTTSHGGNIGAAAGGNVTVSGILAYGNAGGSTSRGGNIYGSGATIRITGGAVLNGNAGQRGGNIYVTGTGEVVLCDNGKIQYGTAKNMGGNIGTESAGITVKLLDGTVKGGSSGTGKNICFFGAATLDIQDATVGGGVYASAGTVKLSGGARVTGDASYNIWLKPAKLIVAGDWTGEAGIKWDTQYSYGDTVAETLGQSGGAYTGKLVYEDLSTKPWILGEEGALVIGTAQLMGNNGVATWYGNNADAVAAYNENTAYLMTVDTALVLAGGDYTVDLLGQDMTISGSGAVTCFDSSNDTYETFGSATMDSADVTLANDRMTEANGKQYVMLEENGKYTFHRLDMRVTSISIRPSSVGIYYACAWSCDDALKENMKSYGVAVSMKDKPLDDFMTDSDTLWTENTMEGFVSGGNKNSVLIQNILEKGKSNNNTRGRAKIFAAPYLILNDGTEDGLALVAEEEVKYSLFTAMKTIDHRIAEDPTNYRRLTLPMRSFWETWKDDGMQTWDLEKIPTPAEDDVIDVLMLGSSFCYYYVEELYGLAEAAGVKMRVCNLYYSGCRFTQQYNWWVGGNNPHEFYEVVDNTGRKKTTGVSLEWALAQGDWDVISIQESTSTIIGAGAQAHLEATRDMRAELIGYLQEQFPKAKTYWHQTWTHQFGYKGTSLVIDSFEKQQNRMLTIRDFALGVCEENNMARVNTGEAWQIFRYKYVHGTGEFADTLCARLGVSSFDGTANSGDGYHDGDIGGGQYLNACVWFETLMNDLYPDGGYTCVGNTYDPGYGGGRYHLAQDLRTALQLAAHQAVVERDLENPPVVGYTTVENG